MIFEGTKD